MWKQCVFNFECSLFVMNSNIYSKGCEAICIQWLWNIEVVNGSSSPWRDDAAPQDKDIKEIASQMVWDNKADIGLQSGEAESDVGVEGWP